MAILGIDYGAKKIGLATSGQDTNLALPLEVLINTGKDKVLMRLKEIFKDYNIKKIVVGVPTSMQEKQQGDLQNEQMKEVLSFVDWLKDNVDLSVVVEDERLSTKMANSLGKDLRQKGPDDAVAAMVVLQNYLDRIKHGHLERRSP